MTSMWETSDADKARIERRADVVLHTILRKLAKEHEGVAAYVAFELAARYLAIHDNPDKRRDTTEMFLRLIPARAAHLRAEAGATDTHQ